MASLGMRGLHKNRSETMTQEQNTPMLTEEEKIDLAAAQVLERFRAAFEELAK